MLLLLTGCKNDVAISEKQEIIQLTFSWWGNDERNEYTINAIKEFEKLHPEIKVKCNYSEWSGYKNRYDIQMASNTECDVMQINYAWITEFSEDGNAYYDINELKDIVNLENFTSDQLDFGIKEGKLNAIPIALNTPTFYVNKTFYETRNLEVPKTWNDLFATAEILEDDCYPIGMTSKSAWFALVAYEEQVSGKAFMDMDGKILFGKDELADMLEMYTKLINNKVMPQVEFFDKLQISNGNYGSTIAWVSDASSYCSDAIENGYDMQVSSFPTTENPLRTGQYAKPATLYAIGNNTEHPKEAALLLEYLLNSEEMAQFQGIEKGIPLSSSAQQYLEEAGILEGIQYDAHKLMEETSDNTEIISPYFEDTDLIDAYFAACNDVLYEKDSANNRGALLLRELKSIVSDKTKK